MSKVEKMMDIHFLDVSTGPVLTTEEVQSGQFKLSCECGWLVITNRKYRFTKEDVMRTALAHYELEHSDKYE